MNSFIIKPIPKSLINTKVLLDAYVYLREISNGICCEECPRESIKFRDTQKIGIKYRRKRMQLFCSFCWLNWDCYNYSFLPCPCHANLIPKEIFLRLDEVINQLEEKLKKEFSS
jgi:hypothetical protein